MKNLIIIIFAILFTVNCGKEKNAILHIKSDITDGIVFLDGKKQKELAPIDVFVVEGAHEIIVKSNQFSEIICYVPLYSFL